MRRWSKEPRRISVVEGRATASLARALRMLSCFIYKNETTKHGLCQDLSEHLFHFLFGRQARAGPHEIVRSPTPCDSHGKPLEQRRWERGERTALSIGLPAQSRPEARTLLRASSRFAPGYGKLAFDSTLMIAVKLLNNKGFRVSRQKLASPTGSSVFLRYSSTASPASSFS